MNKRPAFFTGLLATALLALGVNPVRGDVPHEKDIPIAPIQPSEFQGWTNALQLRNPLMTWVVVPEVGRIMHVGPATNNMLRVNEAWAGKTADPETTVTEWPNYGGDWIWPVAQPHWPSFNKRIWPPHPVLDGPPWTALAWRSADGAQHARMVRQFEEPFYIRVTRTMRMDPTQAVVTVRQRIEQMRESNIPFSLWHISQVFKADYAILPVEATSSFDPPGLVTLMNEYPGSGQISECGDVVVYDVRMGGDHKVGSDSRRGWIAAVKGPWILLVQMVNEEIEGDVYPEGGCVLQLFSSEGMGYTEIETMSPERLLMIGETIDNTLTYSLHARPADLTDPCALAAFVKTLVGEPNTDAPRLMEKVSEPLAE